MLNYVTIILNNLNHSHCITLKMFFWIHQPSKISRLTILDESVLPYDCALRSSVWTKIDLKFDQRRETILLAPEMESCLCRENANRSQQGHFIPCHSDDRCFPRRFPSEQPPHSISRHKICQWYIIFPVSQCIYRNTILRFAVRKFLKESETRGWKVGEVRRRGRRSKD